MIDPKPGNYADLDYSGDHLFDNGEGVFFVYEWDGWYWNITDGTPIGPFDTSADAYHDAQGF